MADTATTCPACGKGAGQSAGGGAAAAPAAASGGLEANLAGLLCYVPVGPIPLIACLFFLFTDPYRNNKFIKFHALQSLFTGIGLFAVFIALWIVTAVLGAILGPLALIMIPVMWLVGLGSFILFLIMAFKAYGMQTPKLPFVGPLAAQHAGM